jgi:dihydroorotate dehydrogenase
MLPYCLVKPFVLALDPETAHEMSIAAMRALGKSPFAPAGQPLPDTPTRVMGIDFPNRIGLAAGLDKNGEAIDALAGWGFGFIEIGTVTPRPQPGNPKPRMFRLPQAHALINRLGFNNDGLAAFISNVKQSRLYRQRQSGAPDDLPMLLGLNIGKNAATPIERATDEYLTCLDGVYPYADYVTVNISSPNTKNLRSLQSDEALDGLLAAISERRAALAQQHGKRVPIFLKIAPDLDADQIQVIAETLKRYGLDRAGQVNNAWGVVATNTTLSREAVKGLAHADEAGGLSGAPVLAMSNEVIRQLRAALGPRFPIIGVGGIMSADDAVSKIRAGADVVQIYTGLIYQGPDLVKEAASLIKKTF